MRNVKHWFALVLVVLVGVFLPILAFAQDAGLPDPVTAVQGLDVAIEGGKTAAWLGALIFGVAALRKWGAKLWPVLAEGTVAVVLACLAGALSAMVEPIAAGAALSVIVMAAGQGVFAGLAAAGVVRGAQMASKPATDKPDVSP